MARLIFQDLLEYMVKMDASDLFLNSGLPPSARIHGKVFVAPFPMIEHSDFDLGTSP